MDVSSVKAEIKAWERSFKSRHGRDPSVQDIKQQPDIADKYRLYKKLSKAATNPVPSTSTQRSSDPPSTPPRSRPRSLQPLPTLLLAQPRAIETTAPLSTFNPFSPTKNKGKQRAVPTVHAQPHSNPFTSPFKSKSKSKPQPQDSPDAFPILKLFQTSKTPKQSPPTATTAISRARKRLRGEPVSPSPNKEKRRRVTTQTQTTLPLTKLAPDSSSSEEEDFDDLNSSFITDSPMKAPAGDKSFKLLFDESAAAANAGITNGKSSFGRTKTMSTSRGLFGDRSMGGVDDDIRWDIGKSTKASKADKRKNKPPILKSTVNNSFALPSKAKKSTSLINDQPEHQLETRKPGKRALSDTEGETSDIPQEQRSYAGSSLLPPSPPPANSSTARSKQFASTKGAKGKAKAVGRKKAKTADKHDDNDDESGETDTSATNVKIVDRTQTRFQRTAGQDADDDLDFDSDAILGYSRRGGHEPFVLPDVELEGKVEVDLPDQLRRVLELESADSRVRAVREKQMVEGLIFGRRSTHYDPSKGGEIWDVGENDLRLDGEVETRRDTEGEDDWEGEPVPWEVGEL